MKITFIKTKKGKRLKENVRTNKGRRVENVKSDKFNISKRRENENVVNVNNSQKSDRSSNRTNLKKDYKENNNHKINNEKIMDGLKVIFKKNQLVLLTVALMLITAGYMNYNNSNNELDISLAELGDARLVSANIIENEVNSGENESEVNTDVVSENNINENKVNEEKINENIINEEKVTGSETNTNEVSKNEIDANSNKNLNGTNAIETASNTTVIKNEQNREQTNNNQNYFVQTKLERETMYSQMIETYEKILANENIPSDQKAIASNEIKNINDRKNAISIAENLIKTKGFEEVVILINDNNIDIVVKSSNNLTTEQVAQITNIVSRELKSSIEDIHISAHD